MRFLSLFSGVGGFDLGLEMAGMECVGQVEIDPQCRRVLGAHWPDVWRAEDVTTLHLSISDSAPPARSRVPALDAEEAVSERSIDAVGWASASNPRRDQPVVAGKRAAEGHSPAGVDLICGGFPCQDLSVAGKRAGLDGARSGLWFEFHRIVSELRPAYVLVENVPGLLSSNQGRDFAVVIDGLGELGYSVSWAVLDAQHFGVPQRRRRVFIVAGAHPGRTEAILALAEGCAGHPAAGRTQGQDVAGEAGAGVAHALRARPNASHRDDSDTYVPELVGTLNAHDGTKWGANQWVNEDKMIAVRTAQTGANGIGVSDAAYALDGAQGQAVALHLTQDPITADVALPIEATNGQYAAGVSIGASVRRLTPVECCRLMGLPDDWLDLDPPLADGPKYRMLGNSIVVPCVEWIGKRIMAVEGA